MVFERLLANVRASGTTAITPFCAAVSAETGFATFYMPEGRLTNGSLSKGFSQLFTVEKREAMVVTLAAEALETLFERHEKVLVKIDVEGHEPELLSAMAPIIQRRRPDLIIEVLKGIDERLLTLDCLKGYTFFNIQAEGRLVRRPFTADPSHRDWLLTIEPERFEAGGVQ